MDRAALIERGPCHWELPASGAMKVPVVVCASASLLGAMDDKALDQAVHVACLPGIVRASYVMPDALFAHIPAGSSR